MVLLEIKAPVDAYSLRKSFYHVVLIIIIIFTDSSKCLSRVMDKNYGGLGRRPSAIISKISDDNWSMEQASWPLKHERINKNMLLETKDEKPSKELNQNLKIIPQRGFILHPEHEISQEVFKNNEKLVVTDIRGASNGNFPLRHQDRLVNSVDEDRNLPKLRLDDKPTDKITSYDLTNQKIMDYFFSNDARDPETLQKLRSQGIIINLKGLIPHEDTMPERWLSSSTDREVKSSNNDELLAFKAFETDASPQQDLLSPSFTEDDEDSNNGVIDITKVTSRVDFIEESGSVTRNLSRKRRHWSSPNAEDTDDDEHSRRRFFRRRRRRRKRRHRHSKVVDDTIEESDVAKLPLKSHAPAYVITSAKELKKDWCRTVPLKQRIEEKNCKSKVISNNFCYGQCNSFFIPHQGRTGNTAAAFQSCAFCKPNKQRWINVTLHCPGQEQNKIGKRILLVESCRCMTEILQ